LEDYIGENIRKIRKQKNISMSDLAEKCGLVQSGISNIETGKRDPSFSLLLKISDALQISINTLVTPPSNSYEHYMVNYYIFEDAQVAVGYSIESKTDTYIIWGVSGEDLSQLTSPKQCFIFEAPTDTSFEDLKEELSDYIVSFRLKILVENEKFEKFPCSLKDMRKTQPAFYALQKPLF
jgi:transcriptional regulator with XRE-family HTH domain